MRNGASADGQPEDAATPDRMVDARVSPAPPPAPKKDR
jgi:hypothetical protein